MNYGHEAIQKQLGRLNSGRIRMRSFLKVLAFNLMLLAGTVMTVVFFAFALGAFRAILDDTPVIASIDEVPVSRTTIIYCNDGNTVAGTITGSENNHEYVEYKDISNYVIYAFVALEDERFFEHDGIDVTGLFGSSLEELLAGSYHKTITQMLIQNQIYGGATVSEPLSFSNIERRMQEQYLAVKLERGTSKEKILEYYLNTLNLGSGTYGIGAACHDYFGKDVSELSVSEAAALAPMAYSPTLLNPVTYPSANQQSRKNTLDSMLRLGFITRDEYNTAIDDTTQLYLRIGQQYARKTEAEEQSASYFSDALIEQVLEDLEKAGYTSYEATTMLYSGGLRIYSTQDAQIQSIVDREFEDESNFPAVGNGSYYELSPSWALSVYTEAGEWKTYDINDLINYYRPVEDVNGWYYHKRDDNLGISPITLNKEDLEEKIDGYIANKVGDNTNYVETGRLISLQPQASMVVMDPYTGNVLAVRGCRGIRLSDYDVNRATSLYRQPGSAFSVPAVYLPALDSGKVTLATTFDDSFYEERYSDTTDNNSGEYITNWYTSGYEGLSSVRRGIYHSMNIVTARCYDEIGATVSGSYLNLMGFNAIDDVNDRTNAISQGILTNGVTLLELTAAYASIDDGGVYNEPRLYTAVYTYDGKLLLENTARSGQVCTSGTAMLLTSAMTDTIRVGTGMQAGLSDSLIEVAGKSGISKDNNDTWFVGYSNEYCVGIWSGFDTPFSQTNLNYHKTLWGNIMSQIHTAKNIQTSSFPDSDSIVYVKICSKCGNLAVDGLCDENAEGNMIRVEAFDENHMPVNTCNCCTRVTLCKMSGCFAGPNCPETYQTVLLNKTESPDVLLNGGTADSAYIITEQMRAGCGIHY